MARSVRFYAQNLAEGENHRITFSSDARVEEEVDSDERVSLGLIATVAFAFSVIFFARAIKRVKMPEHWLPFIATGRSPLDRAR